MLTWYYYVKDDGTAYWTTQPPCYSRDRCFASIVSNGAPTQSPFEMQMADFARKLAGDQQPLGEEFSKILSENISDLYVR